MHRLTVLVLLSLLASGASLLSVAERHELDLEALRLRPRHLGLHQHGAKASWLHKRPIITGCLEECETTDQACVTDCQVCAERNHCPSLRVNCTSCLNQARDTRTAGLGVLNLAIDSGGVSLKREGLRQRLEKTRFEATDAKRALRVQRGLVLQAQRDAESAMKMSHDEDARLLDAKTHLQNEKRKAAEWELNHVKKVKRMRAKVAELRVEHMRTLSHLREVRRKLHVARKKVKRDPNDHGAIHEVAVYGKAWKRLRWKVEEQKEAVIEAEEALKKEQEDGAWVMRGIRKDVQRVAQELQGEYKLLRGDEGSERAARKRLNLAKQKYQKLSDQSQELAMKQAELRTELRAIKMPDFSGEGPDDEEGEVPEGPPEAERREETELPGGGPGGPGGPDEGPEGPFGASPSGAPEGGGYASD